MLANSFTTAWDVARDLNQSRATVVCSALTVRFPVHRSNERAVVVLKTSQRLLPNCPERRGLKFLTTHLHQYSPIILSSWVRVSGTHHRFRDDVDSDHDNDSGKDARERVLMAGKVLGELDAEQAAE